jgi:hypothetical protein
MYILGITFLALIGIVVIGAVPLFTMYNNLRDVKPYLAFTLLSILYLLFGVLFLLSIKARLIFLFKNLNFMKLAVTRRIIHHIYKFNLIFLLGRCKENEKVI